MWTKENWEKNKITHITILSDSRVALMQIKKMNTKLTAVTEILEILKYLRNNIQINLNWVKGHAEIKGNERADLLARSAPYWLNNTIFNYTPTSWLKRIIRENIWKKWQKRWNESNTGRITHGFIPDVQTRNKNKHLAPNFMITQMITGHGNFNNYLKRFLNKTNGICQCTLQEIDSPEHIIYHCPNYSTQRKQLKETVYRENENWPCKLNQLINNKNIYKAFKVFTKKIGILN
ncbi:uncharacterized protein LOC111634927 [Centruroides sculpturatus]|uniref:uncharacterized protein LOC111634927 n=1 Tax=Centruroides sculpturatus TaxID=218467 RepID=UPI000C6CE16C|nr:uncharacterized protein LOC111634927 [Centruroides sculpturatus]